MQQPGYGPRPNATNGGADAYLRTRVLSASPQELRLMLIDGGIRFCHQAAAALDAQDFEVAYNAFTSAQAIISELMTSVGPTVPPEMGENVRGVFTFIYTELVAACHERKPDKIKRVLELLDYERETWVTAMEKVAEELGTGASDESVTVQTPAQDNVQSTGPTQPAGGFSLSA